ncbi:hypothetical protein [Methylobacterium indicum]|uniref:hypothetical protein n=1 Tax=Methylobacterium indicum TaxID=1775910 RepID=UPI002435859A|nr:hypothetical protein [Methylobacterium indicum]
MADAERPRHAGDAPLPALVGRDDREEQGCARFRAFGSLVPIKEHAKGLGNRRDLGRP